VKFIQRPRGGQNGGCTDISTGVNTSIYAQKSSKCSTPASTPCPRSFSHNPFRAALSCPPLPGYRVPRRDSRRPGGWRVFICDQVVFASGQVVFASGQVVFASGQVVFASDQVVFASGQVVFIVSRWFLL
jgi:hypothetical protein